MLQDVTGKGGDGALNLRKRPHTHFWNSSRLELVRLRPTFHRRRKLQTDSKPFILHALTINDPCLGMETGLGRAQQHALLWLPALLGPDAGTMRTHVFGERCLPGQ